MAELFTACPCCGSILREHSSGTAEDYEEWVFSCGGRIHLHEDGNLYPDAPCRQGLAAVLLRLNDKASTFKRRYHDILRLKGKALAGE